MIRRYIISLMAIIAAVAVCQAAETPRQTLDRAVAALRGASGISAEFSITQGGHTTTGRLRGKGAAFSIITPSAGAWYDGKSLTSWSAQSGEATISTPTAGELRDTNPLLFLSAASDYKVAYGKSANASQKVLVLTPAKRGAAAKKVTVTLNAASLTPSKIRITPSSGGEITVTLRNISLKAVVKQSEFSFPKSRYPKAKIIDLR